MLEHRVHFLALFYIIYSVLERRCSPGMILNRNPIFRISTLIDYGSYGFFQVSKLNAIRK